MTWTARDIHDQSGTVAVITGANGGLGLETARELARKGAHVVMAARNIDKADLARGEILDEIPAASLQITPLDLGSLESVHTCASRLTRDHDTIDLLVNNAGVMGTPRLETEDGFELQFGTNHLGHFALTAQLMLPLLRAASARVVNVTSMARLQRRKLDSEDPHSVHGYDPWMAYGQSKMANYHFTIALNQRLVATGSPMRSVAAHPGFSNTNLQTASVHATGGGRSQRFFEAAVQRVGISAAQGALPQLRAATDPAVRGGELFGPRWATFGAPVRKPTLARSRRADELETLWKVSERETDLVFDVKSMVDRAENR